MTQDEINEIKRILREQQLSMFINKQLYFSETKKEGYKNEDRTKEKISRNTLY